MPVPVNPDAHGITNIGRSELEMKKVFAAFVLASALPFGAQASSDRITNAAAERVASAAVEANSRALERKAASASIAAEAADSSFFASLREAAGSIVSALFGAAEADETEVSAKSTKSHKRSKPSKSFAEEMAAIPEVNKYLTYYTDGRGRGIAIRGYVRSREMEDRAREIFKQEGVPIELVWLAQVESGWRSTALSPVGASGVWQFMPATGE